MKAFWVTFYSYKGGVGRSTALANVAGILAKEGRRVLMVDFDLEAPGLDTFEEFQIEGDRPGIVEYVSDYRETGKATSIQPYVQEVQLPEEAGGKLWLLPAGKKDGSYNRQRSAINWSEFYQSDDGALFFENLKADIEDTFRPDYVLIDSRTGLTDVGGICTAHLPNLVVLLFALNEQNLRGIASVAKVLERSSRTPQLLPVATPVPNFPRDSRSLVDERFARAKELLGVEPKITINYSAQVSLRERVYSLGGDGDRSPIGIQYNRLKDAITEAAPEGLDYLIRQGKAAIDGFDPERAAEIRSNLESAFADRADAWLSSAELSKILGEADRYESGLKKALEVDPNNETAFTRIESYLKVKKRWEDLVAITGRILEGSGLRVKRRDELEHRLGLLLMHLDKPRDAFTRFLHCFQSCNNKAEEKPSSMERLIAAFNLLESARRAAIDAPILWEEVIQLYEQSLSEVSSELLSARLNRQQAVHIAYACCGRLEEAVDLLEEIEKLAGKVSPHERLFSVADYTEVNRERFLERNQEMLKALSHGKLWDDYALPTN